jgi:hypothetical protein
MSLFECVYCEPRWEAVLPPVGAPVEAWPMCKRKKCRKKASKQTAVGFEKWGLWLVEPHLV